MGRRAFTISLLAFLGFVILQTVSADEPSEELAGSLLEPSENQFRLVKSPYADAKTPNRRPSRKNSNSGKGGRPRRRSKANGNGKGNRKVKGSKKQNKKGNRKVKVKGSKKTNKKGKGKKDRNPIRPNLGSRQTTCDEKKLCQRIKLYIKYSNQQRKAKRILRTCKTMKSKHDKAETEFEATAAAIKNSDDTNVTAIQATLATCKTTAKALCADTNVAQCSAEEQTKINACVTKLKAWIDAFGPGASSCLGQPSCCTCINSIEPAAPDDCLNYDDIDKESLKKKTKCTKSEAGGGGKGSFGDCRKQQQLAAEQGPPAFGKKCKNGAVTTAKPSGRKKKAVLKIRKELYIKK